MYLTLFQEDGIIWFTWHHKTCHINESFPVLWNVTTRFPYAGYVFYTMVWARELFAWEVSWEGFGCLEYNLWPMLTAARLMSYILCGRLLTFLLLGPAKAPLWVMAKTKKDSGKRVPRANECLMLGGIVVGKHALALSKVLVLVQIIPKHEPLH